MISAQASVRHPSLRRIMGQPSNVRRYAEREGVVQQCGDTAAIAPTTTPGVWRAFATIGLVVAITQIGFFLTSAALPLYLRDLGAPEGRIGLEVGSGNLAALFVMLALGPALNRRGPRPFITLGAALYLVAALAMIALPAEGPVTLFRVLQGTVPLSSCRAPPRSLPASCPTALRRPSG